MDLEDFQELFVIDLVTVTVTKLRRYFLVTGPWIVPAV
jgi:hypothetical protein